MSAVADSINAKKERRSEYPFGIRLRVDAIEIRAGTQEKDERSVLQGLDIYNPVTNIQQYNCLWMRTRPERKIQPGNALK